MSSDRRSRLAPVFTRYADECLGRAEILLALLQDQGGEVDLKAVILHAHTLAGSGATMGAELLSSEARRLEEMAKAMQEAGRAPDQSERQTMAALAATLLEQAKGFEAETMLDAFIAKMFAGG
jgi:HPt (histidine-containing phosphotransfer) domain-containing protein